MREDALKDDLSEEEESEINLTPMLDVVFIMLIFFIVTAVFVREPGVDVERPDAVTALQPDRGSIFIAITAGSEVWIDRRQVDIPAVRGAVERLAAEYPEGGVVIQADISARNRTLIQVMDAVKQAGIQEVTIATLRGQ
jgi:biopolymer transport protein ExbD